MHRSLAAVARILHAAKRRSLGGQCAFVDADNAGFQCIGQAPDTACVVGVEIGREPEWRVVGLGDDFGLVGKTCQRSDRTESLFAGAGHAGVSTCQHRGCKVVGTQCRQAHAAGQHDSATRYGVLHVAFDLLNGARIDHRADLRCRIAGRADLQCGHTGHQQCGKAIVHGLVHEHAVGADAGLAAVAEFGGHQAFDGGFKVGIFEHDEGRIPAKLQRELLERVGRAASQVLAYRRRASEGDFSHPCVVKPDVNYFRCVFARCCHDVQHSGWHAGLLRQGD